MSIAPQQLPDRVSNFIAYGAEQRAPDPTSGGDVITIRPQVYVRYYPGIVVSDLQEGGRSGDREGLVTVHFDPASIGFKDPISAHMNSDDQTLPTLRNSLENQVPLAIAVEGQRKKKNSEDGSPISPLTPIHALRGASQPNGDGDGRMMMGPSGNNTSNRVAFVNGQGTQHLQSDPAEWKSLVNNKSGDLPPEGWRNFAPGEDWKEIGAAVRAGAPAPSTPTGGAPASDGGFPTPEQLGNLIQGVVAQSLKDFAPALVNQITQASPPAPQGRPSGKFDEGKPWNPRTSDGRINLGGYVVSSERWVFEWAYRHLTEDLETQTSIEDAWNLSEAVQTLANAVQSSAYGHGFVADRTTASHREAEHWVQWVIKHLHPYPGADAEGEVLTGWAEEVASEASALLTEAGRHAGEYFASVSKRDKNGSAPQSSQSEEGQDGPSEKVVRAFLDVIQKGWDNPDTIRNLGIQSRENGYAGLRVSMATTEDGVQIAYPPIEGQPSGPLEPLLLHRYDGLRSQGSQGGAQAPTQPAQEPTTPQEQGSASPATAQAEDGSNEPDAPQEQAPVPQGSNPVSSLIESLKVVSDEQTLRSLYEGARDENLLATRVYVAPGPNGEVIFGQDGQDGFQAQNIGSVISIILNSLRAAAPANESPAPQGGNEQEASADETPAPQDESSPHPSEEPAPQGEAETGQDSTPQPPETPSEEEPAASSAPAEQALSPEAPSGESGDAQRIAEAAGAASAPDEIAALQAEAEEKGLGGESITVGTAEGRLDHWLVSQKRRASRVQRKK